MNQLYVQIAKNSGFGDAWFEINSAGFLHPGSLMLKEYTEAIIKECASVVFVKSLTDESAVDISYAIEEHFGVVK